MSNAEAQEEEREVLGSIYESDESFTQLSPASFACRVGEQGHPQSFVIEVQWGEGYPDEPPRLSLGAFCNKHLSEKCKKTIIEALEKEADALLGSPMTYSLIQHAQDNIHNLVSLSPANHTEETEEREEEREGEKEGEREHQVRAEAVHVESGRREETLSKRAKRKMADRTNAQGERPRGWNWVDVVKHLSKTGSQPS